MKNIGEKQSSEANMELNDSMVGDYLLNHPEFFIRNAQLIEHMRVPHPVRDSISLVEWHMARLRARVSWLEESMNQLMAQASENENLFYQLLHLQGRLIGADSLQDMLNRLHRWARDLGLAGANVRLFPERWRIGAPSDFTYLGLAQHAFEHLRIHRFGNQHHYLGPLHGPELLVMLPQAKSIGSVAMSLIGEEGDLGVLIFSSRDAHHYQSGQGTHLLQELALMLPVLLERWIERV